MTNPFLLGKIKYVKGTASLPMASDSRVIAIICPDNGNFELFARNSTISKAWPKAKDLYRSWWRGQMNFKLGKINTSTILSDTELSHLIVATEENGEYVLDENALKTAFEELSKYCNVNKRNVHLNKIGTDEEWKIIEEIITNTLLKKGVNVWIYTD